MMKIEKVDHHVQQQEHGSKRQRPAATIGRTGGRMLLACNGIDFLERRRTTLPARLNDRDHVRQKETAGTIRKRRIEESIPAKTKR